MVLSRHMMPTRVSEDYDSYYDDQFSMVLSVLLDVLIDVNNYYDIGF